MARRSSAKKEQNLWFLCEKCKANVTTKDRDQHDEFCPLENPAAFSKCSFVRDGKLYSNQLMVKSATDDIRDISSKQLNSLVFLSESVITLCGLVFGDYVMLYSAQLPDRTPVVRTVWPTPSSFTTTIFVSEEGKNTVPPSVSAERLITLNYFSRAQDDVEGFFGCSNRCRKMFIRFIVSQ